MTRNRQSAKKAGTWLESLARDYLIQHLGDERIDRTPKHGGKDIGDVGGVYTRDGRKVAIECKNVVKTDLSGWVRESQTERINYGAEAGIVVHKKSGTRVPGEQYVTMTLDDLIVLLGSPRPVKE